MTTRTARTLEARALQLVAQREQSRVELRRKLLAQAQAAGETVTQTGEDETSAVSAEAQVDAVLDWLEAHGYLSAERFAESRVHARASRFGNLRIRQELKQHAVALSPEAAQSLKDSELMRARAVRSRRFAGPPDGLAEMSRQARFLTGRGFSPDVIRLVLREEPPAGANADAVDDGGSIAGFDSDSIRATR